MRVRPAVNSPPRWLLALTLGIAALAFLPTLGGGFLGDDFVYVARFHAYRWTDWPRLFTHEWSEGLWGMQLKELRPFAALTFMFDAKLFGGSALGFRLTNLLLHLGCVFAVVQLAWRYARGSIAAALTAGLLFALHPAHAEAVAWITGRVDVLATFCALAFWYAAETWSECGGLARVGAAGAFLFVGVFSKELCLFAPPLLLLRWVLADPRAGRAAWLRRGALLLGVIVIAIIYTLCRRAAFGHDAATPVAGWHDDGAWQRQVSYLAWLAPFMPFTDHLEYASPWSVATIRIVWIALATLIVLALVVAAVRRDGRLGNVIFFTGGWWLATVGGMIVIGYFSPRHLYLPTAGFAIGAGLLAAHSRWRTLLATALLVWCAVAHLAGLRPWSESGLISQEVLTALESDLAISPPGTPVALAVPELHRQAWLWSWSCPQALGSPFLTPAVPAERVLARQGNFYQPDNWPKVFNPVPSVRAAPAVIALLVEPDGRIRHRIVPAAELSSRANALASVAADGITTDEWTDWVKSLLPP